MKRGRGSLFIAFISLLQYMIVPHSRKPRVLYVPSGCSVDRRLKSGWKFADRLRVGEG